MKKICVLLCMGLAMSVFAQTNRAGSIVAIKGRDIQVKNENVNAPFLAGQRLYLMTGEQSIVLEVTFPMQTIAKCRLVSGSAAKLHAGMAVYADELPSAVKGNATETRFTLDADFVLRDANVAEGGIAFPTGRSDDGTARIEKGFLIAETETTWSQWSAVKRWGEAHGYSFGNGGANGQTKNFKAISESDSAQYPVTHVSWRDAAVWCNALTEYYNAAQGKTVLDCVYYTDATYTEPLRTSTADEAMTGTDRGSQDCPYIKAASKRNTEMKNCTATGFRLPTSDEWEYAARYRGSDSTNTVDGYRDCCFTRGDSASGSSASYKDGRESYSVAVFETYGDGSETGVSATAKVKSRKANALGLYDMSGNVWEWCFDQSESKSALRVLRGGSFFDTAHYIQVGSTSVNRPHYSYFNYGFRVSRTK